MAEPIHCEEVTVALTAQVEAMHLELGKVGTLAADEAMTALAEAMRSLAKAYTLSAAALADGLPTAH